MVNMSQQTCPSCGRHKDELEPGHFAPLDPATGTWSCPNGGNLDVDPGAQSWAEQIRDG